MGGETRPRRRPSFRSHLLSSYLGPGTIPRPLGLVFPQACPPVSPGDGFSEGPGLGSAGSRGIHGASLGRPESWEGVPHQGRGCPGQRPWWERDQGTLTVPGSLGFETHCPTQSVTGHGPVKSVCAPSSHHAFPGLQTARALSARSAGWVCPRGAFRQRILVCAGREAWRGLAGLGSGARPLHGGVTDVGPATHACFTALVPLV